MKIDVATTAMTISERPGLGPTLQHGNPKARPYPVSKDCPMPAERLIESLPDAMKKLPAPRSRATGLRWLREYPGLGLTIGGRHFFWTDAREAIGRGVPLDQAARIGSESGRAA